jgi:hypothetical protein
VSEWKERARALGAGDDEDVLRRAASGLLCEALRPLVAPEAGGAALAACDALSAASYERGETTGVLLFCQRGHPCVEVLLEMTEPVPILATRAARKALELGLGEVAPLCDGADIWGLGRLARPYDGSREDLFEVRFLGRSRWQFRHAGEVVFVVENRRPTLPEPALARGRFEALLRDVLSVRDEAREARIWEAVSAVAASGRGSTVVVSPDAAAEARRLGSQGTRISPRALEPEVLKAATGIGGALLIDAAGVCHAIGVILDGSATARGERSRGSRYNSAANYVRGRARTLAVVFSEDGSVDVLAGADGRA